MKTSKVRRYRKTTTHAPGKKTFAKVYAETENASHAVRVAFPHLKNAAVIRNKAWRLLTNDDVLHDVEAQRSLMQANAGLAAARITEIIGSKSEGVALEASKFAYEQEHGKSVQKVQVSARHAVITMDLTGGNAGPVPQEILDQLGLTEAKS